MDSRLEQAKEWAEGDFDQAYIHAGPRAAAEVIQSLPDEWIDAEKVIDLADDMSNWRFPDGPSDLETNYRHLVEIMDGFIGRINELITPPLPTLADMTPEEREASKWMQAQTWHEVGIIHWVDEASEIAQLITRANGMLERKFKDVTPLPDLPRLEWPVSGDNPTVAEHANVAPDQQGDSSEIPKSSLPSPEDVPEGEPWIMQYEGVEGIGCRNKPESTLSWLVIRRDEHQFDYCYDTDITLISRLVPEHKENA